MKEPTIRLLRRLLEEGSIPKSAVPRTAAPDLRGLTDSGAVREERSGAGVRYVLLDPEAARGIVQAWASPDPETLRGLPPRARAVRASRNAKRGNAEPAPLVFLRATRPCRLRNGRDALDVFDLTQRFGVAGIMLAPDDDWHTDVPLGLVENLEPFRHCDRLGADACGCFLYYGGRMSAALLDWLATRPRAPEIVVLPDYDPVGLQEYGRIQARSASPVRLHVPDDIDDLIRDCGKRELLTDNTGLLPSIERGADPVANRIIGLMQRHGRGLEQEVLINLPQP